MLHGRHSVYRWCHMGARVSNFITISTVCLSVCFDLQVNIGSDNGLAAQRTLVGFIMMKWIYPNRQSRCKMQYWSLIVYLHSKRSYKHTEADTEWPPFCRRHFRLYFLEWNVLISVKISLNFVPKCLNNNISALVQIMAWRRPGDKPLSAPMMA